MKVHRVYGIVLRHLFLLRRNADRAFEIFLFPILDLFIWGVTSVYFSSIAASSSRPASQIVLMIVASIILWMIVWRTQMDIPMGLLEDLWNRNLLNLFVSPLSFREWIAGFIALSFVRTILSISCASLVAFLLYQINLFHFGFAFLPLLFLLLMVGWWLGLIILSLILRFGTSVQALAWSLGSVLVPFSAIYYPMNALPHWAQLIAISFPMAYIFEEMRRVIQTGSLSWQHLWMPFVLNIGYLLFASGCVLVAFRYRLRRGLIALE